MYEVMSKVTLQTHTTDLVNQMRSSHVTAYRSESDKQKHPDSLCATEHIMQQVTVSSLEAEHMCLCLMTVNGVQHHVA